MDIQEYYKKVNEESQGVFNISINERDKIGKLHYLSSCIYDFSKLILDHKERKILETVSAHLEISNYVLLAGLYRQAFSSMRLAMEMGMACIYFSSMKIELHEWLVGRVDIKWSKLIDRENGVLSQRFVKAFFGNSPEELSDYREKSGRIYRKLSEYVHGNNDTWKDGGINVEYNKKLFDDYCSLYEDMCNIILMSSIFRYWNEIPIADKESLDFVIDEFGHIPEIKN